MSSKYAINLKPFSRRVLKEVRINTKCYFPVPWELKMAHTESNVEPKIAHLVTSTQVNFITLVVPNAIFSAALPAATHSGWVRKPGTEVSAMESLSLIIPTCANSIRVQNILLVHHECIKVAGHNNGLHLTVLDTFWDVQHGLCLHERNTCTAVVGQCCHTLCFFLGSLYFNFLLP